MKTALLFAVLISGISNLCAQNVGIGTTTPNANALLHVDLGLSNSKGVLFSGSFNSLSTVPDLGAGSRLIYFPGKAAFRVGRITGTEWDNANVGRSSVAMNFNSMAVGDYSTALGWGTTASGTSSLATGENTIASGSNCFTTGLQTTASNVRSVAMGFSTTASGQTSTAMGYQTIASGGNTTSMGFNTIARGANSTVVGMYNEPILASSQSASTSTTPLFIVGNGIDESNRSNAMVILKNGNVGIGSDDPISSALLDLSSTSKGLLVPRMSRVSRDLIASPATSLLIYQTTETPGFVYNAGSGGTPNWVRISRKLDTLVVGAEAFYPSQSSVAYTTNALSARYVPTDGSTADLRAAINLPSGVTITAMKVYYYDESSSANLNVALRYNYLAQGLAGTTPFDYSSSSFSSSLRTANVFDSYVVQNNLYSYYLRVIPSAGAWSFTADISIKGVMIIFEY